MIFALAAVALHRRHVPGQQHLHLRLGQGQGQAPDGGRRGRGGRLQAPHRLLQGCQEVGLLEFLNDYYSYSVMSTDWNLLVIKHALMEACLSSN